MRAMALKGFLDHVEAPLPLRTAVPRFRQPPFRITSSLELTRCGPDSSSCLWPFRDAVCSVSYSKTAKEALHEKP